MNYEWNNNEPVDSSENNPWDTLKDVPFSGHIIGELDAHEIAEFDAHDRANAIRKERIQEIVERDLNEKLTKINELDDAVNAGMDGISKDTIKYDGEEIPVYTLSGLPYAILSSAIDYRSYGVGDDGNITGTGAKTMVELLQNPALWDMTEEEMKEQAGYGEWLGNTQAKGNVIFASYVNSERRNTNERRIHDGGLKKITGTDKALCYGFSHVEGDSIVRVVAGDGETPNDIGHDKTWVDDPAIMRILEEEDHPYYNEVTLRRYSEVGKPRKPDYIIAEDNEITETFLKHAKHFGVPIINIITDKYEDRHRYTDEQYRQYIEDKNVKNSGA